MAYADIALCRMWTSAQRQHGMFVLEGEWSPDLGTFTRGAAQSGVKDVGVPGC